jgi:hypothetical protein
MIDHTISSVAVSIVEVSVFKVIEVAACVEGAVFFHPAVEGGGVLGEAHSDAWLKGERLET